MTTSLLQHPLHTRTRPLQGCQQPPWYRRQAHLQGCACQQVGPKCASHLHTYTRTSSASGSAYWQLCNLVQSPGSQAPGRGGDSSNEGGWPLLPMLRCLVSAACAAYHGAWPLLPASPQLASLPAGPTCCDSRQCAIVTALPPVCACHETVRHDCLCAVRLPHTALMGLGLTGKYSTGSQHLDLAQPTDGRLPACLPACAMNAAQRPVRVSSPGN